MRYIFFLVLTFSLTAFGQQPRKLNPAGFIPKGYVLFKEYNGDLNKDGLADCVLIIKGTDKSQIVTDRFDKKADRNRRGIIILLNKKDHYELASKNYDCFSSEHEDGGVYYPPELDIEIGKSNLYIKYAHGRYGYWSFTFRYQHSDLELIGYDETNSQGPVIQTQKSINFLAKKKITKENTNENPYQESGEEHFKSQTQAITIEKLLTLSGIQDFDELDMSTY